MPQPPNPKIEELRFRLKTDPKTRLFYQLAEELRRGGHFAEAEQVLRQGLQVYPTYLAAWVSLGRVLREQKNDTGAVDALNRALQLDPGNVVAARLLADAYYALGEPVEAIKKYKLVYALLPADEELRSTIERIERELTPPALSVAPVAPEPSPEPEPEPEVAVPEPAFTFEDAAEPAHAVVDAFEVAPAPEAPLPSDDESPFDKTAPPFAVDEERSEIERAHATADDEPMAVAHDESPFEDPAPSAMADALAIESPIGIHIDFAPADAEVASPMPMFDSDEAEVFAPADVPRSETLKEPTETLTMADLYARQGLVDDARRIYEHLLARDPRNEDLRQRLAALAPSRSGTQDRIDRLERWLSRVLKREVRSV